MIDPKRHEKIVAATVNVRLFSRGLAMMLKAVIIGSMVGDSGGCTGIVLIRSFKLLKVVVISVHRGSRNTNAKKNSRT
ncbi:MAG: hypothetical protein OEV56_06740 [Dehalococcoidia bacterium]|nr:hypothetical protein [Dehalococcoidia bacterium]